MIDLFDFCYMKEQKKKKVKTFIIALTNSEYR